MPRTRVQQDQHNERRRVAKQEGKKAIFCMRYVLARYPDIHGEACEFFNIVSEKYPGKRDLCRTHEFMQLRGEQALVKNTMLEPQLEIRLMSNNPVVKPTNHPTTTQEEEEEIPPVIDGMESEEIERIIDELRQDPDLASVFDDIDVSACTTVESTLEEGMYDMDLQLDFQALGEDLPELDKEINW